MSSLWDILGIEPTDDIAAIKKAFAAKAKIYHPEEHPNEFKILQNAYKQAVNYAKHKPVIHSGTEEPSGPVKTTEEVIKPPQNKTSEKKQKKAKTVEIKAEEKIKLPKTVKTEKTVIAYIEAEDLDFSDLEKYLIDPKSEFENELDYIILNPYLRNNIRFLKVWLDREEYSELFRHEDILNSFLDRLSKDKKFVFEKDTIVFFRDCWDKKSDGYIKNLCRYNEKWELIINNAMTKAESQKYSVPDNDDMFSEWSDIPKKAEEESYLGRYFFYASMNIEALREHHASFIKKARYRKYGRPVINAMILTAAVIAAFCLALFNARRDRNDYFDSDKLRYIQKDYEEKYGYWGTNTDIKKEFDSLPETADN